MKIKKYIAPTMPEAMKQIRKELGPEAVILHSKEVQQGGVLGLFKKKKIEVVAALDPDTIDRKPKQPKEIKKKEQIHPLSNEGTNNEIMKEIKQLKKMLEINANRKTEQFPMEYELVYQHLLTHEVDQDIATNIMEQVIKKHEDTEEAKTVQDIQKDTKEMVRHLLSELPFQGIEDEKKVLQFVGPTGVGKTTTIAKIAATLMLNKKKKVAFITTDTYRIAAVEQLKTYARILNVPIEVAYSTEDFFQAIEKFRPYDFILVDTAGRNFRDEKYVKDLLKLQADGMSTYLVLSATAKYKDLDEIYGNFQAFPLKQVIFTKIDETNSYGSLLNIPIRKQVGIAYLTNGQDVPNDIIAASPELIAEMLVGDDYE